MSNRQQQPPPIPQRQIQIELPADLEAIYSNFAMITHSPSEIILDFARVLPNVPKAKIYARILVTPMNAKLLLKALGENLEKYEEKFGEIQAPDRGFESPSERMGFVRD
jgi:DNA-binding Lrp family transcriptional regulator